MNNAVYRALRLVDVSHEHPASPSGAADAADASVQCSLRNGIAGTGDTLIPAVLILDPHDVVLAEVAADLNLDQLKRNLSGVG